MKVSLKKAIQVVTMNSVLFASLAAPVLATSLKIGEPSGGIKDLGTLLTSGIQLALIIAAILTFAFLIWGGIQWITSGGDKAAYESARNRITAALIGLAIVAASWAIMKLVGYFFGVNVFDFGNLPTASDGTIQP